MALGADGITTIAAAAVVAPKPWYYRLRHFRHIRHVIYVAKLPLFTFILIGYLSLVVVEGLDLFHVYRYFFDFTIAQVLLLLAAIFVVSDLTRVSKPGTNSMNKAFGMLAISGVFGGLWVVSVAFWILSLDTLQVFNNLEFFSLTTISLMGAIAAFKINAHTLVRTIDNSSPSN